LDAQVSPRLTWWIGKISRSNACIFATSDFVTLKNPKIFQTARDSGTVVMTKDEDFVYLVERNGPPPQVIWISSGDMPNEHFELLLQNTWQDAISLIERGEAVVEIKRGME
jgi:predicted nuclease of predicted toxin-antitoxin system